MVSDGAATRYHLIPSKHVPIYRRKSGGIWSVSIGDNEMARVMKVEGGYRVVMASGGLILKLFRTMSDLKSHLNVKLMNGVPLHDENGDRR